MSYQGDIVVGQVIRFTFTSRAFATGVPTVLAGSPSMEVYQDDNTTPITTGVTLNVDFSGVVGLNLVEIDTASGYAAQSDYSVVVAAGTVGGVSVVGETVGSFSIANRSALRPTTAGRTLDVTAGGNAGIDWGNIENPTTAQNLSATNIDVDQVVASVSGAVGSVTGNVGGNVTGSVGSVATGGITAASFAAGAIDAAAIATDAIGAAEFSQAAADKVWATTTRQLTGTQAFNLTGNITGNLSGSVGSVTGAVGSVTGNVGGNVNGNVVGNVNGDLVGNVQGDVQGNLDGTIGGFTVAALAQYFLTDSGETYASAVAGSVVKEIADNASISGTVDANVVEISGSAPAADELEAILVGAGGAIIVNITGNITGNLSGSVGSVTGAVGSVTGNVGGNVTGSVGSVVGNLGGNVNGNVVGSVGSVVGNVGGDVNGNVVGSVGSVVGSVGSVTAAVTTTTADQQASADEFLNRNLAGGGSGNTRNVRNALRRLRNRVAIAVGVATVYQENDVTSAWTAAVTTTPSDPVTEVDPT